MDVVIIFLLLVCVAPVARCYSSGLVQPSCDDMRPRHTGTSPQTSRAPFTVTTNQTSYTEGDEITVRLQTTSAIPFAGFMLQAREVGGRIPLGSFSVSDEEPARLLACNGAPNTAVSHTSEAPKTSIQGTWRAAPGNTNPIEFHASFVRDFTTFWVGVTSPSLEYKVGSSDSPTTVSTAPPPVITSSSASTTAQTPTPAAQTISSAGCGVKKVCFSQPLNCDPAVSANCYFLSASMTSPSAAAVQLEMTGPAPGYVSFGFSDDKMMGNDDIYICGLDSSGFVKVQHAFSTGRRTPRSIPLGNVSEVKASASDGIISCSFTSMNRISTQRTALNTPYFLLFAHGPSSNGQIKFHDGTFISDEKVDISNPQVVDANWPPQIIKAHGALMLIAWMTTGTLGMFTGRYLKAVAKGHGFCGKDVWFLVHVSLMSVTVAATIIAFILSFSHVRGWSGGVHPVLGCLVMILSFLQPIVAIFRCDPHHQLRFLFNQSHSMNAVAIKGLAVAAIFTGLEMVDSTQDKWLMKVMGGFVGWEAAFYILLELHNRWKKKDTDDSDSKTESIDLTIMVLFFLGNITFLVALLVGIAMS